MLEDTAEVSLNCKLDFKEGTLCSCVQGLPGKKGHHHLGLLSIDQQKDGRIVVVQ